MILITRLDCYATPDGAGPVRQTSVLFSETALPTVTNIVPPTFYCLLEESKSTHPSVILSVWAILNI